MAEHDSMNAPAELRERFTEDENVKFEVLCQRGAVRLWKSQTRDRMEHGEHRPGQTHYHVTVGDEAEYFLIARMEGAQLIFDAECEKLMPPATWLPVIGLPDGSTLPLPMRATYEDAVRIADAEATTMQAQGRTVEWTGARRHVQSRGPADAFTDPGLILVRPGDRRCARLWNEQESGYEQGDDGPLYLVISRQAADDQLARIAQRFGVPLTALQTFRGAQA